jgi:hypothetical protein
MKRVITALKPGRAITLCWSPKSAISARSIASAAATLPGVPESIETGTTRFVTQPIR